MVKAIIVLVIGLILLGGAGFGGWKLYDQYYGKHEDEPPPPPPPPPATAYVRLQPIVVPLIGKNKVEQFVTVVATVEVLASEQPRSLGQLPRLRDQVLRDLYAAVDDRTIMRGNLVDLEATKKVIKGAAVKILGQDAVRAVLLQVVTQRNL